MRQHSEVDTCFVRTRPTPAKKERRVLLVTLLTAVTAVVEITVGYASGSMALLADGWHMTTHVGALGLSSLGYWVARRYAQHHAFTFGTGKVHAIAGYTSAIALGLVALVMFVESVGRLFSPTPIDFARSLPVAVVGLAVNLASVLLLHVNDADHDHDHHGHDHHDHNHRAALLHVVADAFTSVLAIVALVVGRYWNWVWLDPVIGAVGAVVITKWGFDLARHAASELVDLVPSPTLERDIRQTLEAMEDVRVRDLHVWPLGGGPKSCVVTLHSRSPRSPDVYRAELARFHLSHLTIEIHEK